MDKATITKGVAIIALLLLACSPRLFATAQIGERLDYKGKRVVILTTPLDSYFTSLEESYEFPHASTACWRGYIGVWKIENKKLYLVALHQEAVPGFEIDPDPKEKFSILGEKYPLEDVLTRGEAKRAGKGKPVVASWYSGVLRIPEGEVLRYVHMGFASTYERTRFIVIKKGRVSGEKVVDNKGYGATRSTSDLEWTALATKPIETGGNWDDARLLLLDPKKKKRLLAGGEVTTRGVYFPAEEKNGPPASLWIPYTPSSHSIQFDLIGLPDKAKIATGSPVEIVAKYEEIEPTRNSSLILKVSKIRELPPHQSMHHEDFKPKTKPRTEKERKDKQGEVTDGIKEPKSGS